MNEADVSKWAKRHNLDLFPSELRAMISDALQLFGTSEPAAQRTWIGLTDEDLANCESEEDVRFVRAIEAKLKEKNDRP